MLSSAFAIFFTGFPHVWSVYQPYVMEQAGWSQTEASMCFYLALATFVFGNIFGGRMMEVRGSQQVMWVGGHIFSAGVMISSFLIMPNPIPFYITYGVMQGFGQGMIYTTIIATAQKWFPDRTGFASGIVVTANGLCGFFLAPLSRMLLEKIGPEYTLLVIGFMIVASWFASSVLFADPEKELQLTAETKVQKYETESKQYTSSVQNADEVDRMMENTDPEYVSLLFDTGHFTYCGADPLEMVKKYVNRIKHVHLKDIRKEVVEQVKVENLSFLQGVRMGTFTVPGDGCIDFDPIFEVLEQNGYEGYMLVEAEQDPAKANPLEYALKARKFIAEKTGL